MPYGVTSAYPLSIISSFTTHVNQTEIVDASHPNLIQAEVYAIESTLGLSPQNSGNFKTNLTLNSAGSTTPSISTYFYTGYTTFGSFGDRVTNVENLAATAYSLASTTSGLAATVTTNQTNTSNIFAIAAMGGF